MNAPVSAHPPPPYKPHAAVSARKGARKAMKYLFPECRKQIG